MTLPDALHEIESLRDIEAGDKPPSHRTIERAWDRLFKRFTDHGIRYVHRDDAGEIGDFLVTEYLGQPAIEVMHVEILVTPECILIRKGEAQPTQPTVAPPRETPAAPGRTPTKRPHCKGCGWKIRGHVSLIDGAPYHEGCGPRSVLPRHDPAPLTASTPTLINRALDARRAADPGPPSPNVTRLQGVIARILDSAPSRAMTSQEFDRARDAEVDRLRAQRDARTSPRIAPA